MRDAAVNLLSPRQREVMTLVGQGLSSREIADRLGIGRATVESQVRWAMIKLGASTRLQAAAKLAACERGAGVEAPPGRLDPEQRRLVELLAAGVPLGRAAASLYLSRRSADRRLAAARKALGVATTAELVTRVLVSGQSSPAAASSRTAA